MPPDDLGAALVSRTLRLLYWWPDAVTRGITFVDRPKPVTGHVAAQHRGVPLPVRRFLTCRGYRSRHSALRGTADSLLDAASY